MADTRITIKIEAKNSEIIKELEEVIHSTQGLRLINKSEGDVRPDLLIFELGKNSESEFKLIEDLLSSDAIGEAFVTSSNSDPTALLQARRTGAKEFLSEPLNEKEVRQALERFKKRREKSDHKEPVKFGQIINVIGSKGGVGTTTVAVNLATSLAEEKGEKSIALLDMNTLFGEIPLFLDIKPKYHWGEITKNISRLDATFLMDVLTKHSSGVHVLPSPSYLNGNSAYTPEIMARLLSLMQRMFDFVIIDGGQSLNDVSLKALEMSNNVLLISLLSLPCLSNTSKLLKSFANIGFLPDERIMIVINRYLKNSDISLKDAEDGINKKIL